jgi:hypothetical protein
MINVKDILIQPIASKNANDFIKKHHYSGKVVNNSTLHFGAFHNNILLGVMSFGNSTNKIGTIKTISNTGWNEFIELNRMAFHDLLPKNSESRCLSIAFMLIKKHYPHIKWIISFSDASQCGDGTIYRASGFKLIGININKSILKTPCGVVFSKLTLTAHPNKPFSQKILKLLNLDLNKSFAESDLKKAGAVAIKGYQLKYIYFLDKKCENDLTLPIIPFSKIKEIGADMYKGKKREKQAMTSDQLEQRECDTYLHAPIYEVENDRKP